MLFRSNISLTSERYAIRTTTVINASVVSELHFRKVGQEDEGIYKCIAANLAGNSSVVFGVRVLERPGSESWPVIFGMVALVVLLLASAVVAFVYIRRRLARSNGAESRDAAAARLTLSLRARYGNLSAVGSGSQDELASAMINAE